MGDNSTLSDMGTRKKTSGARWAVLAAVAILLVAVAAAAYPWASYAFRAPSTVGGGILCLGGVWSVIIICIIDALRKRKGKPALFSPGELMAFFLVVLAGSWSAGYGFTDILIPLLTAPSVMSSSQAGWTEHLMPHIPRWAFGPTEEPWSSGFYRGLDRGTGMPWSAWVRPSLVWGLFAVALVLLFSGIGSVLGRRWVEHDRLTYPHMEVLSGVVGGYVSNRLFWWGAGVAAVIPLFNTFQRFFPVFKRMPTYFTGGAEGVPWMTGVGSIGFPIEFGLLGLLFFVQRDIILSVCIFYFAMSFESYFLKLAGIKFENGESYYFCGSPMDWQMGGALIVFVLVGLWKARGYLAGQFRAALKGSDDGKGWLSPRLAAGSIVVGFLGMAAFLFGLGLRGTGLLAFLFTQLTTFIGMARVTLESGLGHNANVDAGSMAVALAGTRAIGGFGAVAITLCFYAAIVGLSVMTVTSQGARMSSLFRMPRGTLVAMLVAAATGVIVSMYSTAVMAYGRGAITFLSEWNYTWHPRMLFDVAVAQTSNPAGPDWPRLVWVGVGGVMMGILVFLRSNVVGWFLHPVGLIAGHQALGVPGAPFATPWVFIGFLAWGIKSLLLNVVGTDAYERSKPFFAGLVVGSVMPGLAGILVNFIAGPPIG